MADIDPPRRPFLASVRTPGAAPEAAAPPPILQQLLDALDLAGAARQGAAAALMQRLGDARTVELLATGDGRAVGTLLREAMVACEEPLRRAEAKSPGDAVRRLEAVRETGVLRLGAILVAQGVVAPRRLEAALEAQASTKRRIGAQLVAAGHLDAREVAMALWLQHKLIAAALALATAAAEAQATPRLLRAAT